MASNKTPKINDAPVAKRKLPVLSFMYIILALSVAGVVGYGYYLQLGHSNENDPTGASTSISAPVPGTIEEESPSPIAPVTDHSKPEDPTAEDASSEPESGKPTPQLPEETQEEVVTTNEPTPDMPSASKETTAKQAPVSEETKADKETSVTNDVLELTPKDTPDNESSVPEASKPSAVEGKPKAQTAEETPDTKTEKQPTEAPQPKETVPEPQSKTTMSPPPADVGPLPPVPDPDLAAKSDYGLLPVISPDGRLPWRVYARPFDDPLARPRIAIIISDMGMSQFATRSAIQNLPGEVTLSFNPYGRDLQNWVSQARAAGHETLLQLPMEPFGYPQNDPGPQSLLSRLTDKENLTRLEWMLGRFTGYAGVTNQMGSKFTTSRDDIQPILDVIKERGLFFLDGRTSGRSVAGSVAKEKNIPVAINNRFIDNRADRANIDQRLQELEKIARVTGSAIGIGFPYPVTLERVANWAKSLNRKGLVLSPVSAVANRQEIQ